MQTSCELILDCVLYIMISTQQHLKRPLQDVFYLQKICAFVQLLLYLSMFTFLLEKPKVKPRKYATKDLAVKMLSKKAKSNMTKKHLKDFLRDCSI